MKTLHSEETRFRCTFKQSLVTKKNVAFVARAFWFQASSSISYSSELVWFQSSGLLRTHSKQPARETFLWNYFSSEAVLNYTFSDSAAVLITESSTYSPTFLICPESAFSSFHKMSNKSQQRGIDFFCALANETPKIHTRIPHGFLKHVEKLLMANETSSSPVLMIAPFYDWHE